VGGCTQRMQTAWPSIGSALEMPWLALHEQNSPLALHGTHFQWGSFYPSLGKCGYRLSAVTIASSLMGGCGLSHEHVEDGCKSTCVKLGG